MNNEQWRRVNHLFEQAVELSSARRDRFLDEACAGDSPLRAAVERRLRADAEAGSFLEAPPATVEASAVANAALPERLGPYRILHELGSGGMGTVYAAERDDEAFRRLVAIKVIKSSSHDEEISRRLRSERHILALLEHPNIARIYDGGATEDGAPYLVMEHVEGEPIDRYCAENAVPIADRVTLMRKVCLAVHYAHRNLVVHRDLKPSNILVTPDGEPKLLDFGIAKVLDAESSLGGVPQDTTVPWRRLLTLNYASPEQIRGESISTATDIYSLGVLFFLVLTGSLPRSFNGLSPWQAEQRLSSDEPPRPSAAVNIGSQASGQLRGDLDSIVLKALRSHPDARYASAEQLAADLELYVGGFPVRARRGTLRYRAEKLVRRHRLGFAVGAAAVLCGLVLLVSLMISRSSLKRSQALLQDERGKLEQMLGFFLGIFEDAGPYVVEGVDLSLRQAVDRHTQRLEGKLVEQPPVRAALLSTLGWVYLDLGAVDRALEFHQEALALRRLLGEGTVEVAESLDGVAAALRDAWRLDEAESASADAVELYRQHAAANPRHLLRSLNNRVKLFCMSDDWESAEPLSVEALDVGRSRLDANQHEVSRAVLQRAQVLSGLGEVEEALALYRESLALHEDLYGANYPLLAPLYNNLGQLEARAERYPEAVGYLRQADAQYAASFGDDFYGRVPPLTNLGRHLIRTSDHIGAEEALRQALVVAATAPALGPEHEISFTGRPALVLGQLLADTGRCSEAIELLAARIEAWGRRSEGRVVREGRALLTRCSASGDASGAGL